MNPYLIPSHPFIPLIFIHISLNILNYSQYIKHSQYIEYGSVYTGDDNMISYKPFYDTLLKKNITEYHLIYKEGISANTLHRMKNGLPITTKTLDTLCFILDCEVSDVLFHDKSQ